MKRVAIYARVSTNEQFTSNQVLVLKELAERNGARVVAEFVDEGQSGIKKDRDALNAMLTAARKRQFDALYVVSICRLSRSVKNLIETVETLNDLGIELVFQRENINTKTATGNFFLTVLGSLYELEREVLIERINAGIARAKSQGKSCGRPSKINDGLINAVKMLKDKGVSIRDICKTCGIGIGTCYKIIRGEEAVAVWWAFSIEGKLVTPETALPGIVRFWDATEHTYWCPVSDKTYQQVQTKLEPWTSKASEHRWAKRRD